MSTYDNTDRTAYIALGMMFGAAAGIGLGMIMAPRSGQETRNRLCSRAQIAKDKARVAMHETRDSAMDRLNKALDKSKDLADKATSSSKEIADEAAEHAQVATDRAKEDIGPEMRSSQSSE